MVKQIYKQIGLKNLILLTAIMVVVSGIGAVIFERVVLPQISSVPLLRKLKILDTRAPIVITRHEEVRIQGDINTQEVVSRAKTSLVRVYVHDGAFTPDKAGTALSGLIVARDGLIVIPNSAFKGFSRFTVMVADGLFYEATLAGVDEAFGLAFLRVAAQDLSVMNFAPSQDVFSGENLLGLSATDAAGSVRAETVTLLTSSFLPSPAAVFDLARANFHLATDDASPVAGTALTDKDAQIVGWAAQSGKEIFYLPASDLNFAVDSFLSREQKIAWPKFKLNYSILDPVWAEKFGYGKKFGVLIRNPRGQLRVGDFVFAVDGKMLSANLSFQQAMLSRAGQTVKLELVRGGTELEVEIAL